MRLWAEFDQQQKQKWEKRGKQLVEGRGAPEDEEGGGEIDSVV